MYHRLEIFYRLINPERSILFESRLIEIGRQRQARIAGFIERRQLLIKMHHAHDKSLFLLDTPGLESVDPATLEKYLEQRCRVEDVGVTDNCFDIADISVQAGVASGVLEASKGTNVLLYFTNHRINYHSIADGSIIAIDFTARENIANYINGHFDVMALRAPNLDELVLQVGELYGGEWHEVSPAQPPAE